MKHRIIIVVLLLFVSAASLPALANNDKKAIRERVAAMTTEQKETRAVEIKARVEEIQAMNKLNLSADKRRQLRHELRDMNMEAKALGSNGIYISLAGVVAIILVLIIIL